VIFIDTGPLVARHFSRDQYHQRAVTLWRKLERSGQRCATSPFVVNEVATLLARWAGAPFAVERVEALYRSEVLTIERAHAEDELAALDLMKRYGDQQIGFTDCLSFALMRKAGIRRAFTFDRHFRIAGFEAWG